MGANRLLGFTPGEAASIGIIGGADGPTTIYLTSLLAPHLLGPVAVAAYSYMSLVPIIQPRSCASDDAGREGHRHAAGKPVSEAAVIAFPIVTAAVTALAVPSCAALVGLLMFGNLLRESGVTERLSRTAGGTIIDIATIFLGVTIGATMAGPVFLSPRTLYILALGAVAFVFSTAGGILFAKALNLVLRARSGSTPASARPGCRRCPCPPRRPGFRLPGHEREGEPADGGDGPERGRSHRDRRRGRGLLALLR